MFAFCYSSYPLATIINEEVNLIVLVANLSKTLHTNLIGQHLLTLCTKVFSSDFYAPQFVVYFKFLAR